MKQLDISSSSFYCGLVKRDVIFKGSMDSDTAFLGQDMAEESRCLRSTNVED
jgi:hypothetical protein